MPKVTSAELYRGTPYLLAEAGLRHSLGWQDDRTAGASFVLARLSPIGTVRVKARFPLTETGWAGAWQALCRVDAGAAAALAPKLAARADRSRAAATIAALDAESLCCLRNLTLKGAPGDARLAQGKAYDLRFHSDRLTVCAPGSVDAVAEVPYQEVEAVEVGAPRGTSRSPGELAVLIAALGGLGGLLGLLFLGLVGLLLGAVTFGLIGAMIGIASTNPETEIRVRGARAEYFFLQAHKSPDAVRMELSIPLRAISAARAAPPVAPAVALAGGSGGPAEPASGSIADELSKLASLLQQGLVTRDEFDQLKAKLIAGP